MAFLCLYLVDSLKVNNGNVEKQQFHGSYGFPVMSVFFLLLWLTYGNPNVACWVEPTEFQLCDRYGSFPYPGGARYLGWAGSVLKRFGVYHGGWCFIYDWGLCHPSGSSGSSGSSSSSCCCCCCGGGGRSSRSKFYLLLCKLFASSSERKRLRVLKLSLSARTFS